MKVIKLNEEKSNEFDRLLNEVNGLAGALGTDWLKFNGKAIHPDYAKRELMSIKRALGSKVNSGILTKDQADELNKAILKTLRDIKDIKMKYTGYGSWKSNESLNEKEYNKEVGEEEKRSILGQLKFLKRDLVKYLNRSKNKTPYSVGDYIIEISDLIYALGQYTIDIYHNSLTDVEYPDTLVLKDSIKRDLEKNKNKEYVLNYIINIIKYLIDKINLTEFDPENTLTLGTYILREAENIWLIADYMQTNWSSFS